MQCNNSRDLTGWSCLCPSIQSIESIARRYPWHVRLREKRTAFLFSSTTNRFCPPAFSSLVPLQSREPTNLTPLYERDSHRRWRLLHFVFAFLQISFSIFLSYNFSCHQRIEQNACLSVYCRILPSMNSLIILNCTLFSYTDAFII